MTKREQHVLTISPDGESDGVGSLVEILWA